MVMGSMMTSYRGYQKEMSTKVMNAETKELTFEYLVDEKWDKTFYLIPIIFLCSLFSKTMIGERLKPYANQKL
jgi:hypothetical protein